jgi:hypothetical protein
MSNRINSNPSTAHIILDDNNNTTLSTQISSQSGDSSNSSTTNNNNNSNSMPVKEAGDFRYQRLDRDSQYSSLQVTQDI